MSRLALKGRCVPTQLTVEEGVTLGCVRRGSTPGSPNDSETRCPNRICSV
jgi:hypothetical protein